MHDNTCQLTRVELTQPWGDQLGAKVRHKMAIGRSVGVVWEVVARHSSPIFSVWEPRSIQRVGWQAAW